MERKMLAIKRYGLRLLCLQGVLGIAVLFPQPVSAESPTEGKLERDTEDIPEEVLRTQLILEGRSPIDGLPMTPEDYAKLQQQLTQSYHGPLPVDSELQSLVFQLKLLNLLKTVLPGL